MDMSQDTVSIVVGLGGRINMLTEEQANRLLSSGQASIMSSDQISVISSDTQETRDENMCGTTSDEALAGSGAGARAVGSLLEGEQSLGCLAANGGIMTMERDKEMHVESGSENLRVIVQEEGEDLRCLVDADGNKIDVAIESQQGINAGDMVQVYLRDDSSGTVSLVKEESGSYCLQATSLDEEVLLCSKTNMAADTDTAATSPEDPDNNNSNNETNNTTTTSKSHNQVYKCPMCTYSSIYKNNYHRHVAKHNSDQELLHCRRCSFNTIYKHSLKRHMLTHPEEKLGSSTTSEPPDAGAASASCQSEGFSVCDFCPYKTKNTQHLKRHLQRHTNEKVLKTFTCESCGYTSKYKQHYERHLLKHSGKKTYKCNSCEYATPYIDNYKRHCIKHSKEKSFSCDQCSYSSAYPDNYKRHMLKHSGEKSFFCPHCNYASAYSDNYERHLLKHSNGKIYSCTSCNYRSAYVDNYKRHLLKHSRDKLHTCQYCSYSTVYIDNYRRHVTVHTGEGAQTCPHCNYSTTIKYKFKQHMSLHTGHGLIQCPYCPYKTPRKYQFKRHLSIHTQEGRYNCTICSHSTAYKSSHRKHMLKHGKEPDFDAERVVGPVDNSGISGEDNNGSGNVTVNIQDQGFSNAGTSSVKLSEVSKIDAITREQMNLSPATTGVSPLPTRSIRQIKSKKNTLARVCVANTNTVTSVTDSCKKSSNSPQSDGNLTNGVLSSGNSMNGGETSCSMFPSKIRDDSSASSSGGIQTARVAPMTRVGSIQQQQQQQQQQHQQQQQIEHQLITHIQEPTLHLVQDVGAQNLLINRMGMEGVSTSVVEDLTSSRHALANPHSLSGGGQPLLATPQSLAHNLTSTHNLTSAPNLTSTLAGPQNMTAQNLTIAGMGSQQDTNSRSLQELSILPGTIFCNPSSQDLTSLTVQDLSSLGSSIQQQALGSRQAVTYSVQGLNLSANSTTTTRSVASSISADELLGENMDGTLSSITSSSSTCVSQASNFTSSLGSNSTNLSSSIGANLVTTVGGSNPTARIGSNHTSAIGSNQGTTMVSNEGTTMVSSHDTTMVSNQGTTMVSNQGTTMVSNHDTTNQGSTMVSNHDTTMVSNHSSSLSSNMDISHRSAVPSGTAHSSPVSSSMSALQPCVSAALHASLPSSLQQTLTASQVIASAGGQSFLLTAPSGALQGREFAPGQYFTPATFTGHPPHITFTAHLPSHITAQLQHIGGSPVTSTSPNFPSSSPHLTTTSSSPQTIAFVQHTLHTDSFEQDNDSGG